MANLILPRRFTQQPQQITPISRDGFCRDVGFVYAPSIGYIDLANQVPFAGEESATTPLTIQASTAGVGGFPTSGTGYAQTGATNFRRGYTLFAVCSASGSAYEAIMDDDPGGTRGFQFRFTNTGAINFIPFSDADGFASVASDNFTAAELLAGVAVVAKVDAAGNISVFAKKKKYTGTLGAAPRIPGNIGANQGIRFFRWKGGGNQLTKPLYLAGALYNVASDDECFSFIDNPWQIFRRSPQVLYFDVGGGATVIDLTSASFGFTANTSQNYLNGTLTAVSQAFTAQDTQNRQTITPTAPSLTFTANAIQNRLSAALTAATMSFTAHAINVIEGAATFVIDLTAATFAYTAQSVQLAQSIAMSAASLVMTGGAVAMTQAVSLTAATLSFIGQAIQNRLTIGLAAAAIGFTAWALDVTGAIASAAARMLMLMGVGS